MTRAVRWTTRAASQLIEAGTFLERERPGAGYGFLEQVESILAVAADHPAIFPRVPDVAGNAVRRGLVRRYGYWVIYEVRPDNLLVLSIWHVARRPEGWREDS